MFEKLKNDVKNTQRNDDPQKSHYPMDNTTFSAYKQRKFASELSTHKAQDYTTYSLPKKTSAFEANPTWSNSLYSSFNNSFNSSNSSGFGSSISPTTSSQKSYSSMNTDPNCTISSNKSYFEELHSPIRHLKSHSPGDYRVIALDAKPGPGKLEDFIPEVERNFQEKSSQIPPNKIPTFKKLDSNNNTNVQKVQTSTVPRFVQPQKSKNLEFIKKLSRKDFGVSEEEEDQKDLEDFKKPSTVQQNLEQNGNVEEFEFLAETYSNEKLSVDLSIPGLKNNKDGTSTTDKHHLHKQIPKSSPIYIKTSRENSFNNKECLNNQQFLPKESDHSTKKSLDINDYIKEYYKYLNTKCTFEELGQRNEDKQNLKYKKLRAKFFGPQKPLRIPQKTSLTTNQNSPSTQNFVESPLIHCIDEEIYISKVSHRFYGKNWCPISKSFDEDAKEWRQFIADQRLPSPGNWSSKNRIDADSRLRIVYPKILHSEDSINVESKRPIIQNLSNADFPKSTEKDIEMLESESTKDEEIKTISGRNRCAHCSKELGQGAAMIVESLNLFYHLKCFRCFVCHKELGNGAHGTDVRVRNQNKLHCSMCFNVDNPKKPEKIHKH